MITALSFIKIANCLILASKIKSWV